MPNVPIRTEQGSSIVVRVGLVGTGYWAEVTHAQGLSEEPSVDFVGIWGRGPAASATLAGKFDVKSYADYDEFLDNVEAVAFAVPPAVQAVLAVRAAEAGKHLLLEKPIGLSVDEARRVERAVRDAGVANVVNFSWRFNPDHRVWLSTLAQDSLTGAWVRCFSDALISGSPYANSGWRKQYGALWDVTPHVLAMLLPVLGPVDRVEAGRGVADLVHLIFHHVNGATGTASLTLNAPTAATDFEFTFWGPAGRSPMPSSRISSKDAFKMASYELSQLIAGGKQEHPCDVRLGLQVVETLALAQKHLDAQSP
jgi:predicted dehydrogenase